MIIHREECFGVVWVVAPCPLDMILSFHDANRRGNEPAEELELFRLGSNKMLT